MSNPTPPAELAAASYVSSPRGVKRRLSPESGGHAGDSDDTSKGSLPVPFGAPVRVKRSGSAELTDALATSCAMYLPMPKSPVPSSPRTPPGASGSPPRLQLPHRMLTPATATTASGLEWPLVTTLSPSATKLPALRVAFRVGNCPCDFYTQVVCRRGRVTGADLIESTRRSGHLKPEHQLVHSSDGSVVTPQDLFPLDAIMSVPPVVRIVTREAPGCGGSVSPVLQQVEDDGAVCSRRLRPFARRLVGELGLYVVDADGHNKQRLQRVVAASPSKFVFVPSPGESVPFSPTPSPGNDGRELHVVDEGCGAVLDVVPLDWELSKLSVFRRSAAHPHKFHNDVYAFTLDSSRARLLEVQIVNLPHVLARGTEAWLMAVVHSAVMREVCASSAARRPPDMSRMVHDVTTVLVPVMARAVATYQGKFQQRIGA